MSYVENLKSIVEKLKEIKNEYTDVNKSCGGKIPVVFVRSVDDRDPRMNLELETNILTSPSQPQRTELHLAPYLISWRGRYDELSVNMDAEYTDDLEEYIERLSTYLHDENSNLFLSVSDFIDGLLSKIGNTFTGYKGGEYVITEKSPLWIDLYGTTSFPSISVGCIDMVYIDSYYLCVVTCINDNIHFEGESEAISETVCSYVEEVMTSKLEGRKEDVMMKHAKRSREVSVKTTEENREPNHDWVKEIREAITETLESSWYKIYSGIYAERFRYMNNSNLVMFTRIESDEKQFKVGFNNLSTLQVPEKYFALNEQSIESFSVGRVVVGDELDDEPGSVRHDQIYLGYDTISRLLVCGRTLGSPNPTIIYSNYYLDCMDKINICLNFGSFLDSGYCDQYAERLARNIKTGISAGANFINIVKNAAKAFNNDLLNAITWRLSMDNRVGVEQKFFTNWSECDPENALKALKLFDEVMFLNLCKLLPENIDEFRPMFTKGTYININHLKDVEITFALKLMDKLK